MRTFTECDRDGNGRLEWNNGEIRNFITACFRQQGSPPPSDQQVAAIYSKFDADNNGVLDRSECLRMVDVLFAGPRQAVMLSGNRAQATMRTFTECDRDGNGRLEWNNGEIRNFITACFRQQGSSPPSDQQVVTIYRKFDVDNNGVLDRSECLRMVDVLFQSTSNDAYMLNSQPYTSSADPRQAVMVSENR